MCYGLLWKIPQIEMLFGCVLDAPSLPHCSRCNSWHYFLCHRLRRKSRDLNKPNLMWEHGAPNIRSYTFTIFQSYIFHSTSQFIFHIVGQMFFHINASVCIMGQMLTFFASLDCPSESPDAQNTKKHYLHQ